MEKPGIRKFAGADCLCCPRCGSPLVLQEASLRCAAGHCYDVSARGYVNLLPAQRPLRGYDQAFFAARKRILAAGYYRHIQEAVNRRLSGRVVDLGCGEGCYARAAAAAGHPVIALDAALPAIREASTGGGPVLWLVADLARPPLQTGSADTLLNIFTPANYQAFRRLLAPRGCILKVLPGPDHLRELRSALGDRLRGGEAYDNQAVVRLFRSHFRLMEALPLKATLPITPALLADFLRMTPLAFGLPAEALAQVRTDRITVEGLLLEGCLPEAPPAPFPAP